MKNLLLIILGGCLLSLQSFGAKKYIVTVHSPQIYKQIQAQAKGLHTFGSFSNSKSDFNFLSQNPQAISETLDNLDIFILETDNEKAVEALKSSRTVSIEEDIIFPEPKPVAKFDSLQSSYGALSGPIETPWGIKAVKAPEAWATSREGEGARVLVLDTGIDKDHPALKERFEAGRNFMSRTDRPAYDFLDTNGHGTHVAGTIAADGVNGNLVGVAPKAKILAGRVCSGGCSAAAIISGVDWGISQNVDVISMSLGGPFPSGAAIRVYQRAEAANIVVVAASGNDGTPKVSYPAAYDTTYAVGAIGSDFKKADFSQWGKELNIMAPGVDVFSSMPLGSGRSSTLKSTVDKSTQELKSAPMSGSGVGSVQTEVVFAGLGKPENFKNLDVTNKVVLVQRGEISFKDKADAALRSGASAVVIYNNTDELLQGTLGDEVSFSIPVIGMDMTEGESLKAAIQAGSQVSMNVSVEKTDYASMQGTSMATPHVSGVVALVRAANPAMSAKEVRDLLTSTAAKLSGSNKENQLGAGLVDAEAAVNQAFSAFTSGQLLTGTF